jgi:hypothetical protein
MAVPVRKIKKTVVIEETWTPEDQFATLRQKLGEVRRPEGWLEAGTPLLVTEGSPKSGRAPRHCVAIVVGTGGPDVDNEYSVKWLDDDGGLVDGYVERDRCEVYQPAPAAPPSRIRPLQLEEPAKTR